MLGTVVEERDFGPAVIARIVRLYPPAQRGLGTGCYVADLTGID
jgi:hypothetical protein